MDEAGMFEELFDAVEPGGLSEGLELDGKGEESLEGSHVVEGGEGFDACLDEVLDVVFGGDG